MTAVAAAGLFASSSADAYVYWANQGPSGGSVGRALNDGTAPNGAFIPGASTACGPYVTSSHVYWGNRGSSRIGRANLDGTSPNQNFISTGSSLPCGVVANATHIYWANGGVASSIGRVALDGTTGYDNNFITGASEAQGLAINSSNVFWGEREFPNSHVGRAALDGTGGTDLIDVGAFPAEVNGVAVNATHIFWTDPTSGNIGRANINGSSPDLDFISGLGGYACGVAVDDQFIYWANADNDTIGRVGLDGTTGFNASFITTGVSTPCGVAVNQLPNTTTTTVSCSPGTVQVGNPTTCTATVTDSAGTPTNPTGTITFSTPNAGGFSPATTCTLAPQNANAATCSVTYTPTGRDNGTHQVNASYPGDPSHTADDGATTVTVNGKNYNTSTSCIPNPIYVNQAITCSMTLTPPSPPPPSGSIDLTFEGPGAGTPDPCPLTGAPASSCSSVYTPSGVGDGSHGITLSYPGDSIYGPIQIGFNIGVMRRSTTTGVGCIPASVVVGQATTCTATVTDTQAEGTKEPPVNDVGFSNPASSGSFSGGAFCTPSASGPAASSCTITYTPTAVGSGSHSVRGDYAGSTVHLTSDGTFPVGVNVRPTSTAVACAPASLTLGQSSNCTVTVTDTGPGAATSPAGTVPFVASPGGGSFGSGGDCDLAPTTPSASECSISYTPAATGSSQATANYPGDPSHAVSTGAATVQTAAVPVPPVPVSPTPAAGPLTLDAPPTAVVGGSFAATCSVPAGALAACRVSAPKLASGDASGSGASLDVTVKVTKKARKKAARRLGGLPVALGADATTAAGGALTATDRTLLLAERQTATPKGTMFGAYSSVLTESGKDFLRSVAREAVDPKAIRCEGHTASTGGGDNPFTRALAMARAIAACDFLATLGVKAKLSAVSLGKRDPRAPNSTRKGRADNRYVSLTISR